ncbi:MAG: hypothetical protein GX447_08005 [Elusimicrobia bacterium]|nr:hypothetical protein [Elusimicrobiota bacterium]
MLKNKYVFIYLLLSAATIWSQEIQFTSSGEAVFGSEKEIETGDISVSAKIRGTPSAYETYDIYAPFDGRIDEVRSELFDLVYPQTTMARAVTKDMAALLDTANTSDPESKKQILKRWKGAFDYYDIKPQDPGIVVNVYVKPKDYVSEGDKLFTVAKRMQIIAINTEPIYSQLSTMMKAKMASVKDDGIKVDLYLKSFVPLKDKPFFYRLWMDIEELKDRIKIGETFEGTIFVGESKNAKLADRKDILIKDGKRYMLMEIKPGLISADKVEILSPTKSFLPAAQKEEKTLTPPAPSEIKKIQSAEKNEQVKSLNKNEPAPKKVLKKKPQTKKPTPAKKTEKSEEKSNEPQ